MNKIKLNLFIKFGILCTKFIIFIAIQEVEDIQKTSFPANQSEEAAQHTPDFAQKDVRGNSSLGYTA